MILIQLFACKVYFLQSDVDSKITPITNRCLKLTLWSLHLHDYDLRILILQESLLLNGLCAFLLQCYSWSTGCIAEDLAVFPAGSALHV